MDTYTLVKEGCPSIPQNKLVQSTIELEFIALHKAERSKMTPLFFRGHFILITKYVPIIMIYQDSQTTIVRT